MGDQRRDGAGEADGPRPAALVRLSHFTHRDLAISSHAPLRIFCSFWTAHCDDHGDAAYPAACSAAVCRQVAICSMSTCGKGSLPFPSRTGSCIVDATDLAVGLIQFAISAVVHQTSTRLWHRCSKTARKTLPRPNYGLGAARKGGKRKPSQCT